MMDSALKHFGYMLLLFATGACGAATVSPYARATAGRIGCPASRIELDEVERGSTGPESWVAFCGHTRYACSSNRPLRDPQARIICSELGRPRHADHWHARSSGRRGLRGD